MFYAFKMERESVYASLLFFSILYSPIDFILSIILNKISRIHEFEADRFSIETYKDKDNLINALKKLSISNLGNLNFSDLAQEIVKLDLVLACDTSILHLSSSLGVKTYGLFPFVADWRWANSYLKNNTNKSRSAISSV